MLPLTIKQFKSMQDMARLQPEIKELQEKYKGDKQRLNQEMMKFYRENKMNPFASCMPLVAQLPVFLSLFYMLRNDLRIDICPDVNPPGTDNPVPCGNGRRGEVPLHPGHHGQGHRRGPDHADRPLRRLAAALEHPHVDGDRQEAAHPFLALPFVFVSFVFSFPAGLLVYWITTNLWTIVQQAIVRKRLGPMRPAGPDGEGPPMSSMDRMLHGRSTPSGAAAATGPPATTNGKTTTARRPRASRRTASRAAAPWRRPSQEPPAAAATSPRKKKKRSGRRR